MIDETARTGATCSYSNTPAFDHAYDLGDRQKVAGKA